MDGGPPTFTQQCDGGSTLLTGTVYAPNGIDPIPKVRVYAAIQINPYPAGYCDKCSAPIDPAYVATVTAADGTYSLDLDAVPAGATVLFTIQIGRFRKWTTLPVTPCQSVAVTKAAETLPGANAANANIPSIAVSSGNTDHLDSVLTTLGITEFDCYEGRANPYYPYAGGGSCTALTAASPKLASALVDTTKFGATGSYNMAFISCAPDAYSTFTTPVGKKSLGGNAGQGFDQTTMTNNTQAWVAAGGRLFVTDTSYDYIAQPYPLDVTWDGPAGVPAGAAQPVDGANLGCSPPNNTTGPTTKYNVTVDDTTLGAWLQVVGIVPVGSSTTPTVSIDGFYEPWSVIGSIPMSTQLIANGSMPMLAPTATYSSNACLSAPAQNVPLTVQYDVPTCGRVLFSSYHTYSGTNGTPANEKIMEYLIFAAAYCTG